MFDFLFTLWGLGGSIALSDSMPIVVFIITSIISLLYLFYEAWNFINGSRINSDDVAGSFAALFFLVPIIAIFFIVVVALSWPFVIIAFSLCYAIRFTLLKLRDIYRNNNKREPTQPPVEDKQPPIKNIPKMLDDLDQEIDRRG